MSNFSEQNRKKEECRERNKMRREKMATFFYDCAKLILAGVVVGGFTPLLSDGFTEVNYPVVAIGFAFTIALAWIGNKILQ
mgnify:CR=1 FL=1